VVVVVDALLLKPLGYEPSSEEWKEVEKLRQEVLEATGEGEPVSSSSSRSSSSRSTRRRRRRRRRRKITIIVVVVVGVVVVLV